MSTNDMMKLPSSFPDDNTRGTISSEELAAIMERARGGLAGKAAEAANVETLADTRRREQEERDAWERWERQQQHVRVIDADTVARTGQANAALARSLCITGGATLAGFLLGGGVVAVLGCGIGWIANRLIGGKRS